MHVLLAQRNLSLPRARAEKATGRVVALKKVRLGDAKREEGISRSAFREIKARGSAGLGSGVMRGGWPRAPWHFCD